MPIGKSDFPYLSGAPILLIAAVAIYAYSNQLRLESADAFLKGMGPSEQSIGLKLGFNPRCGITFVSVGFWQRGPRLPERQGYICGGLFTSPRMEVVPFHAGLVLEDIN
jgi:hypothetical protein